MAKSLKIIPGDEASSPSRGPKPTQATGWVLAVNGEPAAVPGPRDHPQGSRVGGDILAKAAGPHRPRTLPMPPWPGTNHLAVSTRPAHAPRYPLTLSLWASMVTSCPERAGRCQQPGSGARTLCPGPQTLRDRVGSAKGVARSPLAAGARGVEPDHRTARAGLRARLGGNPEGGPRGPLRLESAGHRVCLDGGAAQWRFILETAPGGGGGWS